MKVTIVEGRVRVATIGIQGPAGVGVSKQYVDDGDTAARARANHTGTQPASSISDFDSSVDARVGIQKGASNGLATLGNDGKVPTGQLPANIVNTVSSVNARTGAVTGLAEDSAVLHNTGAESVAGVKTFASSPVIPTPAGGTDATNKSYVDSAVSSATIPDANDTTKGKVQLTGDLGGTAASPTTPTAVHLTGDETVAGIKTFANSPVVPTPTTSTQAASKGYVDTSVSNLVASAPGALDTLDELAAALGDDANFAATTAASLANKLAKSSDLSDLSSASAARTNLGLGTAATVADSSLVHRASDETITGAKTFSAGKLLDKGSQVFDIRAYAGFAQDLVTLTDGAISSSSTTVTSASAPFAPSDVGKYLLIFGAGAAGVPLGGAITAYISATQVTVAHAATTTVSGAKVNFGTDNSAARDLAVTEISASGGGILQLPAGQVFICNNMSAYQKHNLWIRGTGIDATTVICGENITPLNWGTGDGSLNATLNAHLSDLTVDMNSIPGATYGVVMGNCANAIMDRVRIKNQTNGAKSMFFWGVNSNAASSLKSNGLSMSDCEFGDSTAAWEAVTLAQGINAKLVNCTFRDKTSQQAFLNYGSYNVSLTNCHFRNCSSTTNGMGNTTFLGCDFFNASLKVQTPNTTIVGCTWDNLPGNLGGGLSFLGYKTDPTESGWDSPGPNYDVSLKNNKVLGCSFRRCSSNAINAGVFTGVSSSVLSCDDLLIDNCSFELTDWQAVDVKANYLTMTNNTAWNSGQFGTSPVRYNFVFAALYAYLDGNRSYDDQVSHTATRDYFIDNQYTTLIPTMTIRLANNKFQITGTPYFFTGGSFTGTTPGTITIVDEGTVKSASVTSANGFAGSVATSTSTPAITLSTTVTGVIKGNGTAISAAVAGTDYAPGTSGLATGILKSTTSTGALSIQAATGSGNVVMDTAPTISGLIDSGTGNERLTVKSTGANNLAGVQIMGRRSSADKKWTIDARAGIDTPNDRLAVQNNSDVEKLTVLDGGNVGLHNTNPAAPLVVGGGLQLFDTAPTGSSADAGYLFGTTIPEGLVTEVSGQILTTGLNVAQVGTRDTARTGGIVRIDSRSTNRQFVVIGVPTGGSAERDRMSVNLEDGTTHLVPYSGNVGIGLPVATSPGSALTFGDGKDIAVGTSAGTKFGTATTQKLGFYNATPVVQPTGDIITALQNLGLVATATISEADVTNLTTDLAAKAPLASPALTGSPTAPTQTANDNSTKIATTAYVDSAVAALTANTQTASYTLALTDVGKVVEMNVASGNTLTIPPNSSVAFPAGTIIEVLQYGAGQVTLTPGSGVTLRSSGSRLKTAAQYSSVSLRKRATDEWVVAGDVSA